MHSFFASLSYGKPPSLSPYTDSADAISQLARIYERARNALEYRADHLVRRAAIERIIKRQLILDSRPPHIAAALLQELKWANYLTPVEIELVSPESLTAILGKYLKCLPSTSPPNDWLQAVMSAEIETLFNLNIDYQMFTSLAYATIKNKIALPHSANLDIALYVAVHRVYTQSDEAQIGYHLLQLVASQAPASDPDSFRLAWTNYQLATHHPYFNKLTNFVRIQMPPLVLIRDMYFAHPTQFAANLTSSEGFASHARYVLHSQLKQLSDRIHTATWRSITYIFLTKMLIALILEGPIEVIFSGRISYLPLGINLAFPPLIMWLMAQKITLPNVASQKLLVDKAWQIVFHPSSLSQDEDLLTADHAKFTSTVYLTFSTLYLGIFFLVFVAIFYFLSLIHFSLASQAVFVFFLTIVSFFAFKIRQTAHIYTYRPQSSRSTFSDMVLLPIVAVGSLLSRGVSRLNFLAFFFDFILEAPFKITLRFLDRWIQFLTSKKEEVIG